jgi:hypothetical protein
MKKTRFVFAVLLFFGLTAAPVLWSYGPKPTTDPDTGWQTLTQVGNDWDCKGEPSDCYDAPAY